MLKVLSALNSGNEKETFKITVTFKNESVTVTIINETGTGLLKEPFNISGPVADVDAVLLERYGIFMTKRTKALGVVDNADSEVETNKNTGKMPVISTTTSSKKKKTTSKPPSNAPSLDLKEKEGDDNDDDDNTGEEEVVETAPVVKAPPPPTPAELAQKYIGELTKKEKEQFEKIIERLKLMKSQTNPDDDIVDFLRNNMYKLLIAHGFTNDQAEHVISMTCPRPPAVEGEPDRFAGTEVNKPEPAPWEAAGTITAPQQAATVVIPPVGAEAKAPAPEPVIQAPVIQTPAPIVAPPKQDPAAEKVPEPKPAAAPGGMSISKDLLF